MSHSLHAVFTGGLRHSIIYILLVCGFLLTPAFAQAEVIERFQSDVEIKPNASFVVTETIIYNFDSVERHGIYREIPFRHPQEASVWYKRRSTEIKVVSVSRDGMSEPYQTTKTNEQLTLIIGRADTTITGPHTYTIKYEVSGGLSYLDDGTTELYWNVTGNNWPVTIKEAVATVGPVDVLFPNQACYQGSVYETDSCDQTKMLPDVAQFVATNLISGEGLTIGQALNANLIAVMTHESVRWWVFVLLGSVVGVLGGGYVLYRFETKYRPGNRTIIPQYEPFPDVLPMFAGVLIDGKLHPRDITAGILRLAQEGIISIKHTEKKLLWLFDVDDYEITMQKDIDLIDDSALPSKFHRTLLSLFFTVTSKGVTVKMSDLKSNESKRRKNAAAIKTLRVAVVKDLEKSGFFELYKVPKTVYSAIIFIGTVVLLVLGNVLQISLQFVWVLVPIIIMVLAYFFIRNRRTTRGYEALYHLKGFKQFLSVTDKERFSFHNAPAKNPEQFMDYLPYAVAFGVEKEWSKAFKDITIPAPDWYDGGSTRSFSATALTNDLGIFSTAMASGVISAPSSSSSGGSGGGGFSGGGGGGGGGGSW